MRGDDHAERRPQSRGREWAGIAMREHGAVGEEGRPVARDGAVDGALLVVNRARFL
jgi:hypothetical protein